MKESKSIKVVSNTLCESLIDLGCTERKTNTIIVSSKVLNSRDFWRGCIDGDGCLRYNNKYFTIDFRSKSTKFIKQFSDFCSSKDVKHTIRLDNCFKLEVTDSSHSFKLANILYKDCCFAMRRKLDIYNIEVESRIKKSQWWLFK